MAKTYYDYQRRDPESRLDWNEVGRNFTDMLQAEQQVRQDKKAAIDESTREFQQLLRDEPHGANTTANQRVLEFAGTMQNGLLMHERALKQGYLSPQDYTVNRQNGVDGTNDMFEVARLYNENLAETMERMETSSSAGLEQFLQAEIDKYGNWNKAGVFVNPDNLVVSAAGLNPDGSVNPKDLRAMSALKDQVMQRFDPYALEAESKAFADNTGTWSEIVRLAGQGGMKGVMHVMKNPMLKVIKKEDFEKYGMTDAVGEAVNLYLEAETAFIEGQLSGMNVGGSLLWSHGGGSYGYARENQLSSDKKEREKQILATDVGGYQEISLTDEQKKIASRTLRDSIRNKQKVEISNVQSQQETYANRPVNPPKPPNEPRPPQGVQQSLASYRPWWDVRNAPTIEERKNGLKSAVQADTNLAGITITEGANGNFTVYFDYTADSGIDDVINEITPDTGDDYGWFTSGQHMYDIINEQQAQESVSAWSADNEPFPSIGGEGEQISFTRQAPVRTRDYLIDEAIFDEDDFMAVLSNQFSESDQYMGSARFEFREDARGNIVVTDRYEGEHTTVSDPKKNNADITVWMKSRVADCNNFNSAGRCLSGGDEEVEVDSQVPNTSNY